MSAQLCLPLFAASAEFEVGRLQAARLEGMYDGANSYLVGSMVSIGPPCLKGGFTSDGEVSNEAWSQ